MTIESCVNFCDGQNFNYAGLEWYQECYCGNYIINGGAETTSTDCSFPCTGDANEVCGAGNRLSMYHSGRASPPPPQVVPSVGSWVSQGCYTSVLFPPMSSAGHLILSFLIRDNAGGRTLPFPVGVSSNTIESCTSACRSAGYNLAGTEYAAECWCGYSIQAGGAPAPATECNMLCSGDNSQYCGGPNRLNIYKDTDSTSTPPAPPEVVARVGPWVSQGCYMSVLSHIVSQPFLTLSSLTSDNAGGRTLPFLAAVSSNTIESCTSACSDAGYDLAGTEYSAECWCGNSIEAGGAPAPASECNMVCSGNPSQYCGGPNRLNLYNIAPDVPSWVSLGCYSSVLFLTHVLSPS